MILIDRYPIYYHVTINPAGVFGFSADGLPKWLLPPLSFPLFLLSFPPSCGFLFFFVEVFVFFFGVPLEGLDSLLLLLVLLVVWLVFKGVDSFSLVGEILRVLEEEEGIILTLLFDGGKRDFFGIEEEELFVDVVGLLDIVFLFDDIEGLEMLPVL